MADSAVADPSPDLANGAVSAGNEYVGLAIPPMDPVFFAQGIILPDSNTNKFDSFGQGEDDFSLDGYDFDLDFCFEDILPASLEQPPLPDSAQFDDECFVLTGSDPNLGLFQPDRTLADVSRAFKTTSAEFPHNVSRDEVMTNCSSSPEPEVCQLSGDQVSGHRSSGMNQIFGDRGQDVSGYLNVSSPESNGSKGSNDSKVLNCPSPESQGSGNCRSDVSDDSNKSVSSSPNCPVKDGDVDSKIKLEELNSSMLKRKKENDDTSNIEVKTNKFRKSTTNSISSACNEVNSINIDNNIVLGEEDEKKRTRLMRNRESAQLSRQRKKHYVEELEDKVKGMHSTIQDLNAKISYFMAENATLRQQMGGVGVAPPMAGPPPPGMYPHPPAMVYPWMPCGVPPYIMKPQGSQVPLVPIPRLKPQQAASAPRVNKKPESKKSEQKTKKVASISFLGLLFFMLLFGGLVPMVNVRFGDVREALSGGSDYVEDRFYEKHHGRVLTANINGTDYGQKFGENGKEQNGSVPLVASLYVPRNDRLVKIDGNLIIHSVLASEKAMASHRDPATKAGSETSLAVSRELAPVVPVSGGRSPHLYRNPSERQRALGSTSAGNEKSPATDGRLQQWFREGLAGPMLSSGMCTEVFHFDVSAASGPGAIVPVPATANSVRRNVTVEQGRNSTHAKKEMNRRILRGLPATFPGSSHNISKDGGRNSRKERFHGNNSLSSMVVSVLVDPREVGDVDVDVDGVLGAKSLSRIFVVVLIDSVKYVTYSCMLPFKGAGHHLVTT